MILSGLRAFISLCEVDPSGTGHCGGEGTESSMDRHGVAHHGNCAVHGMLGAAGLAAVMGCFTEISITSISTITERI